MNYKTKRKQNRKPRNAAQNRFGTSFPMQEKKNNSKWRSFFYQNKFNGDPCHPLVSKCWKDYSNRAKPNLEITLQKT
jgi:hypothetical protein